MTDQHESPCTPPTTGTPTRSANNTFKKVQKVAKID